MTTKPAAETVSASHPPKLLLSAGPDEFAALRAVLLRLHRDHHEQFAALFAPDSRSRQIDKLPPEQSWPLQRFGLILRSDDKKSIIGLHRIRVIGDRFYVMELGGLSEYFQDVWPETDALLAVLDRAKAGRLLDLGCGTGVVAIEAARRGHRVVATDLYETAIWLAQFNARLNGVYSAIEFRIGHQLDPVAGERFDWILTEPHYTRVADQLRVEVLRAAPAHLAPSGTLVVATMFEWQGQLPPMLTQVLGPHSQAGLCVRVEPLPTPYKREWFTVRSLAPELEHTDAGEAVVSRHRFLVTIEAKPATDQPSSVSNEPTWQPPSSSEIMIQPYVPLSRLTASARRRTESAQRMPPSAVVSSDSDVAAMRAILSSLHHGVVTLGTGGPFLLLDACRYGARRCVTPQGFDGAAGAILDSSGRVRPCTHGQPIGTKEDPTARLIASLHERAQTMRAHRGCADCPVEAHCSQCLFPFPLSEPAYCQLMREHPDALPLLPRLSASLPRLAAWAANIPLSGELRIKVRRAGPLIAAQGRPGPVERPQDSDNDRSLASQLDRIRERWTEATVWLAAIGRGHFALLLLLGNTLPLIPISPVAAELAELISDGATVDEVRTYLRMQHISGKQADQALALLVRCLSLTNS